MRWIVSELRPLPFYPFGYDCDSCARSFSIDAMLHVQGPARLTLFCPLRFVIASMYSVLFSSPFSSSLTPCLSELSFTFLQRVFPYLSFFSSFSSSFSLLSFSLPFFIFLSFFRLPSFSFISGAPVYHVTIARLLRDQLTSEDRSDQL